MSQEINFWQTKLISIRFCTLKQGWSICVPMEHFSEFALVDVWQCINDQAVRMTPSDAMGSSFEPHYL